MASFIEVTVSTMDGDMEGFTLSVEDVAGVKKRPHGVPGCIIDRKSQPTYPVWSVDGYDVVTALLKSAGATIHNT